MQPRRISALRALIERPGTPAEGAAAKATLERILARAAHTAAVRAEQKPPTPAAAQGRSQSEGHSDYEEHRRRRAQKGRPGDGIKQFVKRAFRLFFVIAMLIIAFEFFLGLNWRARNDPIIKETGRQHGINPDDPLEHPAPGQTPFCSMTQ